MSSWRDATQEKYQGSTESHRPEIDGLNVLRIPGLQSRWSDAIEAHGAVGIFGVGVAEGIAREYAIGYNCCPGGHVGRRLQAEGHARRADRVDLNGSIA